MPPPHTGLWPFAIVWRPPIANVFFFFRENVAGERLRALSNDDKSLFGTEGAPRRPKNSSESPSNDDRTAPSLGEVAPS